MDINCKNFQQGVRENYTLDELKSMAHNGAVVGFHDLICYSDTAALYEKYYEDIWDMVLEDAEDQGMTHLEMIASFGGAGDVVNHVRFVNLMTWYAAERVAFELTESEED